MYSGLDKQAGTFILSAVNELSSFLQLADNAERLRCSALANALVIQVISNPRLIEGNIACICPRSVTYSGKCMVCGLPNTNYSVPIEGDLESLGHVYLLLLTCLSLQQSVSVDRFTFGVRCFLTATFCNDSVDPCTHRRSRQSRTPVEMLSHLTHFACHQN